MRRLLAAALALVAVSVAAQSPMYSDYPWGLVSNGVDQGPVWNLNCISPGLLCTVDGGNGTASVNVAGGGGALSDAGFITWYADPGLSNERVLSAGNYTVADFGTAGQAQVDWQHGLTCSSGQALTTASTSTLQCTSTITASDLNCSGCVSDAELASNYSGVGACTNQFVRGVNDNAAPTCSAVQLGSDVAGTLPQPNGGTGTGALTCGTAQFLTSNGTAYSCSQGVNGSGVNGYATYWTGTYALSGETEYRYDATSNRLHVGSSGGDTGAVNGYASAAYGLVARNAWTESGGGGIKSMNASATGYSGVDLWDDKDIARQGQLAYGGSAHGVTDKRNALYMDYMGNANGFSVWSGSTMHSRFNATGLGVGISPSYKLHVSDTSTGIVSSLVRNLSNGASAYAYSRVGNDTDDNAGLLRNSSANTAYAGANSLNLYTGSAHPIGIVTNNALRVTVSSGGNVGIGAPTPSTGLHISGTDSATPPHLRLQNTTATTGKTWQMASGNDGKLYVSQPTVLDAVVIDGSGNVGVGTASNDVDARLQVKGGATRIQNFGGTPSSPTEVLDWPYAALNVATYGDFGLQTALAFTLPNDGNYDTGFSTWNFKLAQTASSKTSAGVTGMQFGGPGYLSLQPSGNVAIGVAAAGEEKLEVRTGTGYGLLHSNGTQKVGTYVDSTGGWVGTKSNHDLHLFTNNGVKRLTVTTGGNIDIASFGTPASETHVCSDTTGVLVLCSSSDERRKEKIETLSSSLRMVLQLRPVRYEWKDKGRMGKGQDVGFLAQEVMPILPELVGTHADGTYLLHYDKFAPILVGAIQELYADRTALAERVQLLEDRAKAAEDKLAQLEARLASLEAWSGMAGCPPDCQPKP